jgi:cytochrome c oxidase subunit 2
MQVFRKIGLGISAMLVSFSAFADYSWNFPTPATPMALDTLHVHNKFMLISMAIFVSVLVIMIYSIFSHRKSKNFKAVADKAPSTAVEIFWTLIPFVILLLIDFVIMGIPAYHSVVMMENTREKAEMVIKITGSQWRWQYEYLDGDAKGIKFVSNLSTPKEQTDKGFDGKKDEHYLLEVDNRLV